MLRHVGEFLDGALRAVAAVVAGALPRRYWPALERWIPVKRLALVSALLTIALAALIGVPGFFRHATGHADFATELMLQVGGWRPSPRPAGAASDAMAVTTWIGSYFSLFTFLLATSTGLLTSYLALTGVIRAALVFVDDASGDPLLTGIDALAWRMRGRSSARRVRAARERLEGPEVADRLVTGPAAGLPDAEIVVVASRRKLGWDPGTFIITSDKWYRLGTPIDRQLPGGLRTLYPLTELRDHEVLRRGMPYELPPLAGGPPATSR